MANETEYRQQIIDVGRRLYERKLLVAKDGNMSIRTGENEMLITASGFCKGELTPEQVTKTDLSGRVMSGLKPAADIHMHLAVYKCRPQAKAVVHAHPAVTTGFAISGQDLSRITLPEVIFHLGKVGVTEYATPTTMEVPRVVTAKLNELPDCKALVLANHGALTFSHSLMDAFYKMETLEVYLTATLVSKILGNENVLSQHQLQKVVDVVTIENIVKKVVDRVMNQIENKE